MSQFHNISTEEIASFIYHNKIKLFAIPFIATIIIAIASLFIENEYKSQANLLPSSAPSMGISLFSNDGGISNFASSFLGGGSDEVNKFYVILKSRTTKMKVIDHFDLVSAYELEDAEFPIISAMDILTENSSFEYREEGNFVIQVWDKDPIRAKEMVDFYVQLLNDRNIEITTSEAGFYRSFIEQRYISSIDTLNSLRNELVKLQSDYGVIELTEQVSSYFNVIAELTAQQYQAAIRFDLIKQNTSENNVAFRTAQRELNSITNKLNEAYTNTSTDDLILNFNELPVLASEYYSLLMKIEIETEIQKFIIPLYEQAKMEEVKSIPIVTIVDSATVPQLKDRPRRSTIVVLSGISFFMLTLFFLVTRLHFIKNKEYYKSLFTNKS